MCGAVAVLYVYVGTYRKGFNGVLLIYFYFFALLQRGSEELLTHGTGAAVSNGNAISTHPGLVDNNNDAKKVRFSRMFCHQIVADLFTFHFMGFLGPEIEIYSLKCEVLLVFSLKFYHVLF